MRIRCILFWPVLAFTTGRAPRRTSEAQSSPNGATRRDVILYKFSSSGSNDGSWANEVRLKGMSNGPMLYFLS